MATTQEQLECGNSGTDIERKKKKNHPIHHRLYIKYGLMISMIGKQRRTTSTPTSPTTGKVLVVGEQQHR